MKNSTMDIHVGQIIKQYFESHRTRKAALGRKMQLSSASIVAFPKKESIQLKTLLKLSEALEHNFVLDVAMQLPPHYSSAKDIFAEKDQTIAALNEEIKKLTIERDLLLKVKG